MTLARTGEAQALSTYASGERATTWWAIVILIMIESTVFGGLIASYFYLFSGAPVWPPAGISAPDLMLPTIYSVVLFASAWPAIMSDRELARGNRMRFLIGRLIGTVLLFIFLALKFIEYYNLPYQWDDHAYTSIVWGIAFFHSAHVILVILKSVITQTLGWMGFFTEERRAAVQGTTLYWVFVVVAWLPLVLTVYIFPNFL